MVIRHLSWRGKLSCGHWAHCSSHPALLWPPAPCSHFPLPCCCLSPSLLFGAGIVSIPTHTAAAPNGTAPRGPVGAVLAQILISFLSVALSWSAKPHLVGLCSPESLQVWCFTQDLVPVSFCICKTSLSPPKKISQLSLLCGTLVRTLEGRVISTTSSDMIQMPDEAGKKAGLTTARPISAAPWAGHFIWALGTACRDGCRCASHEWQAEELGPDYIQNPSLRFSCFLFPFLPFHHVKRAVGCICKHWQMVTLGSSSGRLERELSVQGTNYHSVPSGKSISDVYWGLIINELKKKLLFEHHILCIHVSRL